MAAGEVAEDPDSPTINALVVGLLRIEECRCPDGRAIDPGAKPLSAWAATIDHIQPISKGGPDLKDNLQAAHRSCNSAKWARWEYSDDEPL
jgi:hypothetical protein